MEDTFIPCGGEPPPDLSYRPPSAPPFELSATNAPADLLQPIEDFHVGLYMEDWLRMASAYPRLDGTETERAAQLKTMKLGHEFGRWVYVRHIDWWWCERTRACVAVRGIEHSMPDEEEPAQNKETVVTYGLRKFADRWIIWTWQQGWPQHGSAPKLDRPQKWRDSWALS